MRLILCTVFCFLMMMTAAVGQTTVPQVILDVQASGFKIEPIGEHTYLRVYDNGAIAFEDYKKSIRAFYHYESNLSPEQLTALISKLESTNLPGTSVTYAFTSPLKQIVKEVKITIPRPNGFQVVSIARGSSAGTESDLKALHQLVCTIESLRHKAVFRLIDMAQCRQ